jgi:serine/threonine protein kinase
MTTRRRDDQSGAPASEEASADDLLLTSDDIFGDLLDESGARSPAPPAAGPPRKPAGRFPTLPGRKGPIKVKVNEPGAVRKPGEAGASAEDQALPDDVAALLDAFSEPGEAPERAQPAPPAAPVVASPPEAAEPDVVIDVEGALDAPEPAAPTPGAEDLGDITLAEPAAALVEEVPEVAPDPILSLVGDSEPPMEEPAFAPPQPAQELALEETPNIRLADDPLVELTPLDEADDDLLAGMLPTSAPPPPVPPPRRVQTAAKPAAGAADDSLQDLLNLKKMREGSPGPVPVDVTKPLPRTGTKFQASAPKKTAVDGVGVDLAALAAEALGTKPKPKPAGEAPPEPRAGGTYGPYRLLERVAVGGMAEVFRAKRSGVEGFEKVVAVKRILPHLSDNKEFVDMFIDEAKMVAGLTHPNIVQISDLGKIDRSYYIAMEYVHGRDLRSILRRAKERSLRVPLDISAFIVNRVCSALEYAHRKKEESGRPMMLVHRDVSPQNILISFEGDVKLTDFGIAKAASKATTTDRGALRGKLLYMSPEQAWGKPMDRRSDIFSLGIVFYEMLTDQKPFLGTSEMSILETVRECRVPAPSTLNPRIPEKLEKVVMKALERDPELRYQDAGEMHRDLERVLHERQPPNAAGLARFLEILFDEAERGDTVADWEAIEHRAGHTPAGLEVELMDPEAPPEPGPTGPSGGKDPMSIQKLLKRFGIK